MSFKILWLLLQFCFEILCICIWDSHLNIFGKNCVIVSLTFISICLLKWSHCTWNVHFSIVAKHFCHCIWDSHFNNFILNVVSVFWSFFLLLLRKLWLRISDNVFLWLSKNYLTRAACWLIVRNGTLNLPENPSSLHW